jgi:hypothetical protein
MTIIFYGDSEDVLHACKSVGASIVQVTEDNKAETTDFMYRWSSYTLVPEQMVFINPPFKPKDVFPKFDRHLAFLEEIPKEWIEWGKKHKITFKEFKTNKKDLVKFLMVGNSEKNVPKFTQSAALHLVEHYTHGKFKLAEMAQYFKLMGFEEPIKLEDVLEIWPYTSDGKEHKVNLSKLLKELGTPASIERVKTVAEEESIPLLRGLFKATQKYYPEEHMLVQKIIQGVMDKRWKPKAGVVLLSHLLLKCNTKSTMNEDVFNSLPATKFTQLLSAP